MTILRSVDSYSAKDNLIILANKEDLSWCAGLLSEEQTKTLQAAIAKDSNSVVLPGEERFIVVEFLKAKADDMQSRETARKSGNDRVGTVKHYKASDITIINHHAVNLGYYYVEGMVLGNYQFLKYFNKKEDKLSALKTISVHNSTVDAAGVAELQYVTDAVCHTRDLVNEPVSYLTATQLSEEFRAMGKEAGFSVSVLDKEQIEALNMGGLLAVNRGSQDPPTFTIMEYKPAKTVNSKPIVLVGKGVVFDTGGLSLKPTLNSMDCMKSDMAGSAVVAGVLYAIAKANLPLHVVGLTPATDNRPGENAYVPGDVITISDGTTIEVLNCDAEGRLILADALHYAKQYEPELVMDFATLTGAAAVAIGPQGIVYMGTADDAVKRNVEQSGRNVFERVVEFPLWEEYAELLKSDIADMKNIGGSYAGAITAGKFLEHFTNYPWLHFDIAGGAFISNPDSYRGKGATGIAVRLVFDFLKHYANQ